MNTNEDNTYLEGERKWRTNEGVGPTNEEEVATTDKEEAGTLEEKARTQRTRSTKVEKKKREAEEEEEAKNNATKVWLVRTSHYFFYKQKVKDILTFFFEKNVNYIKPKMIQQ